MSTSRVFGLSAYQVAENLTSQKVDIESNAKCQIYRRNPITPSAFQQRNNIKF